MVGESTKQESNIVKSISENQKVSITCYQQRKPVDSRLETRDLTKTTIVNKVKASKRKMQMSYKEVECMKKKQKVQLLQLNTLTDKIIN